MSLEFAAIAPHAPIIIPEIGKDDSKKCQKTFDSFHKLAENFAKHDIDTVVVISPHAFSLSYAILIHAPEKFIGDFSQFAEKEILAEFDSDENLVKKIFKELKETNIPVDIDSTESFLDHGAMVPLHFLHSNSGHDFKIIEISYSDLPNHHHVDFGRVLAKAIDQSEERIAVVASGDMSHRLFENHYKEYGESFDQTVVDLIDSQKFEQVFEIDPELVEGAGECAYRSMLILLGVLFEKEYVGRVLSYEAPFGVGYMLAEFELQNEN